MFVVQVNLSVPNQYADTFQELLIDNARATLEEQGCDCFEISLKRVEMTTSFLLYEKYHHPSDFDFHLTTEHFKDFDSSSAHMVSEKLVKTFELLSTNK